MIAVAVDDREQSRITAYRVEDGKLEPVSSVPVARRPLRIEMLSPTEAVVGMWDGRLLRVDLASGSRKVLTKGSGPVTALATGPHRSRLAVAYENGSVEIWSIEHDELVFRLPSGYSGPVSELRFAPDGNSLLVCGYYLTEWDLQGIDRALRSMALGWQGQ